MNIDTVCGRQSLQSCQCKPRPGNVSWQTQAYCVCRQWQSESEHAGQYCSHFGAARWRVGVHAWYQAWGKQGKLIVVQTLNDYGQVSNMVQANSQCIRLGCTVRPDWTKLHEQSLTTMCTRGTLARHCVARELLYKVGKALPLIWVNCPVCEKDYKILIKRKKISPVLQWSACCELDRPGSNEY